MSLFCGGVNLDRSPEERVQKVQLIGTNSQSTNIQFSERDFLALSEPVVLMQESLGYFYSVC